jgi:tetratricopeptide (TPR) repeat protein
MPDTGARLPDIPNVDLRSSSEPVPNDRSAGSNHPADAPASPVPATDYLRIAEDRPRSACPTIAAFCYQALVTVDQILRLGPADYLVMEGLEDVDVQQPVQSGTVPDAPTSQTQYNLTGLQVKYTGHSHLNWSDAAVHEAILEFLVLYAKNQPNRAPRFVFFTPAILGERGGMIARWREHVTEPTTSFIPYLRKKLVEKIRTLEPTSQLAIKVTNALDQLDDTSLDGFTRAVIWNGGNPGLDDLRDRIADELSRTTPRPTMSGRTCVDVLVSHVLFLAARHARNPEGRVIRHGFITSCLDLAVGDAAGWRESKIYDSISQLDQKVDRLLTGLDQQTASIAVLDEITRGTSQDVRLVLAAIQSRAQSTAVTSDQPQNAMNPAPSGSLGIPVGGMVAVAIEDLCRSIVRSIASGEISRALHSISEKLDASTAATERSYLYYLRACAYSGMDQERAHTAANEAAGECQDGEWRCILTSLASLYLRDIPSPSNRQELEKIAQESHNSALQLAAAILLGEIDLIEDKPYLAIQRMRGFGRDIRAAKIIIRASIEQGNHDLARSHMDAHLDALDPERVRYESHIAIKRFFAVFSERRRDIPPNYRTQAMEVVDILSRALAVCPMDTKYRRHEILGNRAQFLFWAGRPVDAIASLQPIVRFGGCGPEIHFVLAQSYAITGDIRRGIEHATACVSQCPATRGELKANAALLRARLYLAEDATRPQVPSACAEVSIDNSLPVEYRNRARALAARAHLGMSQLPLAEAIVVEWPPGERDELYEVTRGAIYEHEGRFDEAIESCRSVCDRPMDDLGVRREALLLSAIALWRKGDPAAAARFGNDAIRIGISVVGCDIPLSCYHATNDLDGAAALESYVLAEDPDNIDAIRSSVHRLQIAADARAVIEPAKHLARVAESVKDAFVACATLWNRGDRSDAARLFLPWINRCESEDHYLLASEACAINGDWSGALAQSLAGFEHHPGSRRVVSLAVQRTLQAGVRGVDRAPYLDRVKAVFTAATQSFTPPILEQFAADPEHIVALVLARHQAGLRAMSRYHNHRLSTLALAGSFGLWHPEAIYHAFLNPEIHLHNGPVPSVTREWAQRVDIEKRRLLLDLPSWCMAHAAGVLPMLVRVTKVVISHDHRLLLRNYLDRLRDELAGVEAGANSHLTVAGIVQPDASLIRDEIRFFDTLVAWLDVNASIESITPHNEDSEADTDHRGVRQHASVVVYGGRTEGKTLPILLDHCSLRLFSGPGLGFNVLLLICRSLGHMTEEAYNATSIRCIRLGLRRMGISFATIKSAYAMDGQRIGDNTISVLAHMREGNWRRLTLIISAASFILGNAKASDGSLPQADVITCIRYLLHGRSFDKKSRRQAIRRMRILFAMQNAHPEGPNNSAALEVGERMLIELGKRLGDGDPGADDLRMPSRNRLLGRKLPVLPLVPQHDGAGHVPKM